VKSIYIIAFAVLALAGCPDHDDPSYVQIGGITSVPPNSTGTITNDFEDDIHRVTMSMGVAIAARCADYCPERRDSCAGFRVDSADPTILDTRTLFRGGRQPTEVVLIAKKAGTTKLRVETVCAALDYDVNVTPPRAP
jgi:hypothetical protein